MCCSVTLLVLAVAAVAVVAQGDSDVLELDSDNFKSKVDKDIVLVEFYAPWCGHCKKLVPEFEKAATALADHDPPIALAKVDCPANNELCGKYGVSGYPTLKIFRRGEFSADYQGPRNADGIVSYMKKQAGPSARELVDMDAVTKFMDSEDYGIIGFFSDEDNELRSDFLSTADSLRDDFRFGITHTNDGHDYLNDVVIFTPNSMRTKLEDSQLVFNREGMLEEFITENFMGLAGVRNVDNKKYFEPKQPLVVVYFNVDYKYNPKGSNYWRNRVIKVAKEFSGMINFAVSDKESFRGELEALGLDTSADVVVGIYDSKGKYAMPEKFSVDSFKVFIQNYLAGELELYVKSEEVPEGNDGPVKMVVGKNFDQIVNDETKDVLVEFYAPWCGHCKSLAPKYEELGEKLIENPSIVIAKSDATANDYPPLYEVSGFPTIFWVPAGSKDKPMKYEGGREVADFISFIKKNATNKPVVVAGEEEKKKKDKKVEL